MENKEFTLDKEFIKEIYEESSYLGKQKIKERFPELFEPKSFDFGDSYTIGYSFGHGPLIIGNGIAPEGKSKKCLVVANHWKIITHNIGGSQVLEFVRREIE